MSLQRPLTDRAGTHRMRSGRKFTATIASFATVLAGVLAVVAAPVALATPAAAAAGTTIVSPANGGTLTAYTTGPLVIQAATAGTWRLFVQCKSGTDYRYRYATDVVLVVGTNTIELDPLQGWDGSDITGSACTASIGLGTEVAFTIVGSPLELSDLTASPTKFYPTVRDGYLDSTRVRFETNRGGATTMTVIELGKQRVVYQRQARLAGAGKWYWDWTGKTTSGKPVLPGKYRISYAQVTDGVKHTRYVDVVVASKVATRTWTVDKGSRDGRTETKGKCRTRDGNEAEGYGQVLDCRGGEYAAITYTFKIPANAKNIRHKVETTQTEDDFAGRGKITKTGTRVSPTKYQVRVQVTGWRATVVDTVELTYKARRQI